MGIAFLGPTAGRLCSEGVCGFKIGSCIMASGRVCARACVYLFFQDWLKGFFAWEISELRYKSGFFLHSVHLKTFSKKSVTCRPNSNMAFKIFALFKGRWERLSKGPAPIRFDSEIQSGNFSSRQFKLAASRAQFMFRHSCCEEGDIAHTV